MRIALAALGLGGLVLVVFLLTRDDHERGRAPREAGHEAPAEPGQPASRASKIVGTVLNERGEEVPGAEVRAKDVSGNRFTAEVAANGTYMLKDLGPGHYRVSAWTPGHWRPKPAEVDAPIGGEVRCDFVAHRGFSIRGRVRDKRDHAVEGIDIRPSFNPDQVAISDATGAFDLGGFHSAFDRVEAVVHDPERRYTPWEGEIYEGVVITLEDGAAIAGVVVRRETGAPVGGAKLRLREERAVFAGYSTPRVAEATSARDGRFRFAGRPAGSAVLEASAPGLASASIELEMRLGDTPVRVELGAGATVAVKVVGPDGQPVQGARVMRAEDLFAMQYEGQAPEAATGVDGRALLEHVEPGRRRIAAHSDRFLPAVATVDVPVDGQRTSVEIALREGGSIEGHAPGLNRAVVVMSRDSIIYREAAPAADGLYRVAGLPAGAYHVLGNTSRVVFVVEGKTTRCDFDAGAVVRGRALVGGAPAEGRVFLVSHGLGLLEPPATPDTNGRFVLTRVAPGSYDLVFVGHGHRAVEVPEGVAEVVADILIQGPTLEGRVLGPDGTGIAGATVRAVPADVAFDSHAAQMSAAHTETSAGGTFRLTLDDGGYVLEATDERGRRALAGPIEAGSSGRVDLRLGDGAVRVRVAGFDGLPVREAAVAAVDKEGRAVAEAFGDGLSLKLAGLPPGTWDVVAVVPRGGFAIARDVAVTGGDTSEVALTIGQGGAVEVTVGASKGGARVFVELAGARGVPRALDPYRFKGDHKNLVYYARSAAAANAQGVARIDGLSAGEYRGRAETADGRTGEFAFTIRDGETTPVRVGLTR